jgi:hypothetical protein
MPEMTPEQKAEMEAYQQAGTPGAPHQMLAKQAGTYDAKIKMWMEPGGPASESTGTSTRSMTLGDRVMVEEILVHDDGHALHRSRNVRLRQRDEEYWSTWNDTMSTGLMISDGTCDAQGSCHVHGARRATPVRKKPIKTRMTSKWTNPTTEVFTMYGPDPQGQGVQDDGDHLYEEVRREIEDVRGSGQGRPCYWPEG